MWTLPGCFTLFLILVILMLVFYMTKEYWTENFYKEWANIYTSTPYPQNQMLEYESTLCESPNTPKKPPPDSNIRCPHKNIVTVRQVGRLGSQMYEHISTWAIAKKTGREPYVQSCMIDELEKIFQNLRVPPFSYLASCAVEEYPAHISAEKVDRFRGSMLLSRFAQLPKYGAPFVSEVSQIFQFKEHLIDESQRLLHSASRGVKTITYVGVHVRRTDYEKLLKKWFKSSMVKPDFFLRQMNVFRNKYKPVMFVVMNDDHEWCDRELRCDDVVLMKTNSSAQDLAIMSSCNHSIIDYGTYGMWEAMLAGGDTFVYNLGKGAAFGMASLLPNWHIVT